MNSNIAIEVVNVSKSFKIDVEDKTKKSSVFNKTPTKSIENKVIDDVTLNIFKGEVIGIIGSNGSGKSTLLSLLAKIMEPDSGFIKCNGKVASILELGMGFHQDMSGRDNIYLKGELYGFSKKEIDEKIESIIDYSGIRQYIDNPVRTYSSGMNGRLAFSIMINVESDIMLVDEVLSVGDSIFSSKAHQHFKKLSSSGKTIIIVSHSLTMLEEMCSRVIWLENGKIKKDGPSKQICSEYQNMVNQSPEIIVDLANAGVSDSQYKLSMLYRDGINFEQNDELYHFWLEQAALQGHSKAQVEYADYLISINDISEALKYYKSAADKGDNDAKVKMSMLHSSNNDIIPIIDSIYKKYLIPGDSINEYRYADFILKTSWNNEDKKRAFEMFLQSADHGYSVSMHQVALMYKDGIGTPKDYLKMIEYLEKATKFGNIPSITMLSDIYSQGKLIPKDDSKAFEYLQLASNLGHTGSMYKLAQSFLNGVGTSKNPELSNYWFDLYSKSTLFQNISWAIKLLKIDFDSDKQLYHSLLKTTVNNSNASLLSEALNSYYFSSEDLQLFFDKLCYSANHNNMESVRKLANLYYDGYIVDQDYSKALKLYESIGILSDSWLKLRIGEMYREGRGVDPDYNKALYWLHMSAKDFNISAINSIINLTIMYNRKDDYNNAICMLTKIAELGNIEAIKKMGSIYYNGIGSKHDYTKALHWYMQAAKYGDSFSINRLGEMYRDGKGVNIDYDTSIFWFKKGANIGNLSSIINLITLPSHSISEELLSFLLNKLNEFALNGNIEAIKKLGSLFNDGTYFPRDISLALKWYKKALMLGDQSVKSRYIQLVSELRNENTKTDMLDFINW